MQRSILTALFATLRDQITAQEGWMRKALQLRHRIKNGLCLQCDYDLRTTPSGATAW